MATEMMQWGKKTFKVTNDTGILSFTSMSLSSSYSVEEKEDTGKKGISKLEDKHMNNREIKLTVPVRWEFCNNSGGVRGEYEWWDKQLQKKQANTMYIGGKKLGKYQYRLLGVNLSDVKLTANGEMKSIVMELSFKEVPKKAKKSNKGKSTWNTKGLAK